jgi:hypothetical protein
MRVLFDQSTPAPLRAHLKAHTVTEARERGWDRLVNGDLLDAAEGAGFEVFLTADKNLRYQQNLADRKIAIIVIGNAQWRVLIKFHFQRRPMREPSTAASLQTIALSTLSLRQ